MSTVHVRRLIRSAIGLAVTLCLPALAAGQAAPTLNLPQERPMNALVGTSGPEWGNGEEGIGRFSGFAYERTLLPRLFISATFGQGYNGDATVRAREFVSGGVPIREEIFSDLSRLTLGAQLGYAQPIGGSRLLFMGGPVWTRISERENQILTDLRFGDTIARSRETFSDNHGGMLFGIGMEFDAAQNFGYRLMVLHNRASGDNVTSLAIGGAVKF